jgi:High-affinity nickel-transport protein
LYGGRAFGEGRQAFGRRAGPVAADGRGAIGFDTTTEVVLLAATAYAAIQGLPYYAVLALPFLFAGGLMLFDTLDGLFMNFAYGWAFARPVRKVYYNLVITGLSIGAAFIIGTIEILGVLTDELHLRGAFWNVVATSTSTRPDSPSSRCSSRSGRGPWRTGGSAGSRPAGRFLSEMDILYRKR